MKYTSYTNYHKREHLWKHKDKWGIIFVRQYLPDMLKYVMIQ